MGEVFEDVPAAFARWRRENVRLGIFSSGAVLAQRWLFRCSSAGDLSSSLHWFFDTHAGAKQDPESYRRIANEVGEVPPDILFVSDVVGELNAARTAGLGTILSMRPGNPPQPAHDHRVVHSYSTEIPSPARACPPSHRYVFSNENGQL